MFIRHIHMILSLIILYLLFFFIQNAGKANNHFMLR